MELFSVVLLCVIAVILIGILTAMKAGFNEIISGLEMIERKTRG